MKPRTAPLISMIVSILTFTKLLTAKTMKVMIMIKTTYGTLICLGPVYFNWNKLNNLFLHKILITCKQA